MLTDSLQTFLSFLQAHVWLAYTTIFLIALSESLALVGLIVPGAILMFAIGTLITTGYLDFYTTAAWAVLGAVAGDGISYWLGARYRNQLQNLWPLSRYPGAFDKGIGFFQRHGGKSVLFGRFVGPLRPIIPAIAGMFGMPLRQFMLINIFSGLAWAPLYLLPGMAFGLSLELAGEVAGRLVLWILILILSVLFVVWLVRHIHSFVLSHTEVWVEKALHWSHRHPTTGQISSALLETNASEYRGLAWLTLLFLLSVVVIAIITEAAASFAIVNQLEQLMLNLPSFIHTPVADALFHFFLSLSHPIALSIFSQALTLWLLWQRQWLLAMHLLLAWALPIVVMIIFALLSSEQGLDSFDITSSLILTSSLLLFLSLLFGNEIKPRYRPGFYVAMAVVLFFIFLSQIYWQHSGFIRASIELLIGISWAALIGIAYRRHLLKQVTHYKLIPVLIFCFFCVWAMQQHKPAENLVLQNPTITSIQEWQEKSWKALPEVREDLRQSHQHPFNLQWMGDKTSITQQLQNTGWQNNNVISWKRALNSLQTSPDDAELFILPHVHNGRYEDLRWVKYEKGTLYVIRLWQSHFLIKGDKTSIPLWFGNVSIMQQHAQLGWHYLQTTPKFSSAFEKLKKENITYIEKNNVLLIEMKSH